MTIFLNPYLILRLAFQLASFAGLLTFQQLCGIYPDLHQRLRYSYSSDLPLYQSFQLIA